VPDLSQLQDTLGSKPVMALDEILDDIIRWKRQQRKAGET